MAMCQYSSKNDDGYQKLVGELQIILSRVKEGFEAEAPGKNKDATIVRGTSPSQATTASSTYCT
jgi:hypothetical protein